MATTKQGRGLVQMSPKCTPLESRAGQAGRPAAVVLGEGRREAGLRNCAVSDDASCDLSASSRTERDGELATLILSKPSKSLLLQAPRKRKRTTVRDVDQANVKNPQFATDYVNAMHAHFFVEQRKHLISPTYLTKHVDINDKMRAILVDWLVDVHDKFKLRLETLFLTVNLIDRFLERKLVTRQKLQLVGITAFLIASKYDEIYPPEVHELVYITDNSYTHAEVRRS